MVDVSPVLSTETVDATESAPADTQVAEAGRTVTVTEPQPQFTTIQPLAPDEALQLDFDPAAVAKAEIKDGNLEITFDNGGIVVRLCFGICGSLRLKRSCDARRVCEPVPEWAPAYHDRFAPYILFHAISRRYPGTTRLAPTR